MQHVCVMCDVYDRDSLVCAFGLGLSVYLSVCLSFSIVFCEAQESMILTLSSKFSQKNTSLSSDFWEIKHLSHFLSVPSDYHSIRILTSPNTRKKRSREFLKLFLSKYTFCLGVKIGGKIGVSVGFSLVFIVPLECFLSRYGTRYGAIHYLRS